MHLWSAGDLTIYAFRHGTLFCARHLGAGDNLRTTLAAASIRPTFVGWASVRRCQLLRECYFLDSIALTVKFLDVWRLNVGGIPVSILGITLPAPPGRPLLSLLVRMHNERAGSPGWKLHE